MDGKSRKIELKSKVPDLKVARGKAMPPSRCRPRKSCGAAGTSGRLLPFHFLEEHVLLRVCLT